jgi:hypothetical protein
MSILSFTYYREILPSGYTQFGAHHGTISIDGVEIPPLYLYGIRTRTFTTPLPIIEPKNVLGKSNKRTQFEFFGMCGSTGNVFRLSAVPGKYCDGFALSESCFHLLNFSIFSRWMDGW